ncbi:MAG: hypothetical protein RSF90_02650, partial [Pygmaiobacter sp.]
LLLYSAQFGNTLFFLLGSALFLRSFHSFALLWGQRLRRAFPALRREARIAAAQQFSFLLLCQGSIS